MAASTTARLQMLKVQNRMQGWASLARLVEGHREMSGDCQRLPMSGNVAEAWTNLNFMGIVSLGIVSLGIVSLGSNKKLSFLLCIFHEKKGHCLIRHLVANVCICMMFQAESSSDFCLYRYSSRTFIYESMMYDVINYERRVASVFVQKHANMPHARNNYP